MIEISLLAPGFKREVMRKRGGEEIVKCFTCGTCTASCPVNEVDATYNPRRIIRMVLLGMKKKVLESDFIWLCAGCFSCQERCPQGVSIAGLMMALRNIAVENGIVHPAFGMQASEIYKYGRLYEIGDLNSRRERLGLPNIPQYPDPVRNIFENIGIDKVANPQQTSEE